MYVADTNRSGSDKDSVLLFLRGQDNNFSDYASDFNLAKELISAPDKKSEAAQAFSLLRLRLLEEYTPVFSTFLHLPDDKFHARQRNYSDGAVLLYIEYLTLIQNQLAATKTPASRDITQFEHCLSRLRKIIPKAKLDAEYRAETKKVINDCRLLSATIAYNQGIDALAQKVPDADSKNIDLYDLAITHLEKALGLYKDLHDSESVVETEKFIAMTYEGLADELFDLNDTDSLLRAIREYENAAKCYPGHGADKESFSIKIMISILNARLKIIKKHLTLEQDVLALEHLDASTKLYREMAKMSLSNDSKAEIRELMYRAHNSVFNYYAGTGQEPESTQQKALRMRYAKKLLRFKDQYSLSKRLTWDVVTQHAEVKSNARKTKTDSNVPKDKTRKRNASSADMDKTGGGNRPEKNPPVIKKKRVAFDLEKNKVHRYGESTVFYGRSPSQTDAIVSVGLFNNFLSKMEGPLAFPDAIIERFCTSLFMACTTALRHIKGHLGLLDAIQRYTMARFPEGSDQHRGLLRFFNDHFNTTNKTLAAIRDKPYSRHDAWGSEKISTNIRVFIEGFCDELDAYGPTPEDLKKLRQHLIANLNNGVSRTNLQFNQEYERIRDSFSFALEQDHDTTDDIMPSI